MAHTFAHAQMTEVALDCGYPASALKEPLYVHPRVTGEPIHCGILIYTATAGNQGTLGGLVEVTRRFVRILKSALERERLCSGDPVCTLFPAAHVRFRAGLVVVSALMVAQRATHQSAPIG
jgi:hypothetical protein